jgi:hypothetical protein
MYSFIETRLFTRLVGDYLSDEGVIWMLTIYPKNVAENIPAHVLRQIRKEVDDG